MVVAYNSGVRDQILLSQDHCSSLKLLAADCYSSVKWDDRVVRAIVSQGQQSRENTASVAGIAGRF